MMYSNKLAFAIKANGKILREFGDKVYVPFGTEYTILIKNLHTTKVLINISVDGSNATNNGLIIDGGKEAELERYLKSDLNKGNRFKFIERTNSIEKSKGIGLEDGLITVNYQFENAHILTYDPYGWYYGNYPRSFPDSQIRIIYPTTILLNSSDTGNITYTSDSEYKTSRTVTRSSQMSYNSDNVSLNNTNNTSNDTNFVGITVPGSISEQKFINGYIGSLESTKHSMVIKLLGENNENKPISKPVTVDIKPKCVTCQKINKASNKFCSSCGTSLQILA